jgi:hypothetical protein
VSAVDWDEVSPARSVWVITLADLFMLLVGFFVLLQANQNLDREKLLAGVRAGFGIETVDLPPMTVATARIDGFATGSAQADTTSVIAWARDAARDRRTLITITGSTQGVGDLDRATGSAAILAADRARTVAAALVRAGAIDPGRITILIDPGKRRAVTLSVGFAGETR